MTGSIKPPGSPPISAPLGTEGARPAESTSKPAVGFRDVVGTVPSAGAAEAATTTEALRSIVADLRAGRIDMNGAVDRFVERAVSMTHGHVPEARRAELETFLRGMLSEDPSLRGLLKDLSRDG